MWGTKRAEEDGAAAEREAPECLGDGTKVGDPPRERDLSRG